MLTRFTCPACSGTHVLDFPEDTTIYMTCGQTSQPMALRVVNGNPKAVVVSGDGIDPFDKSAKKSTSGA